MTIRFKSEALVVLPHVNETIFPQQNRFVPATYIPRGDITVPLPTSYNVDDLFVLFLETTNQDILAPSGWNLVSTPVGVGTPPPVSNTINDVDDPNIQNSTRMTVFWRRATASESPIVLSGYGDHVVPLLLSYEGVIKTGNPIHAVSTLIVDVASHDIIMPDITTTSPRCRILYGCANHASRARETSGVQGMQTIGFVPEPWTNTHVTDFTEESHIHSAFGFDFTDEGGEVIVAGGTASDPGLILGPHTKSQYALFQSNIAIALLNEPETLVPLTISNSNANKNTWGHGKIQNNNKFSILDITSTIPSDFQTTVSSDPSILYFNPDNNFSSATQTITVRETLAGSVNSGLSTTFTIQVLLATTPATTSNNHRVSRCWYSGGQSVFQVRAVPSTWNPAWGTSSSLPFLSLYVTFPNDARNNEQINHNGIDTYTFYNFGRDEANLIGVNYPHITPASAATLGGVTVECSVNPVTGETIWTMDRMPRLSYASEGVQFGNMGGSGASLSFVGWRRAQRDPVTGSVTSPPAWNEMTNRFDSTNPLHVSFRFNEFFGYVDLPNPLENMKSEWPLVVKAPLPNPLPTNISFRFTGYYYYLDEYKELQRVDLTYDPYVPASQKSVLRHGLITVTKEVVGTDAVLTIDADFPATMLHAPLIDQALIAGRGGQNGNEYDQYLNFAMTADAGPNFTAGYPPSYGNGGYAPGGYTQGVGPGQSIAPYVSTNYFNHTYPGNLLFIVVESANENVDNVIPTGFTKVAPMIGIGTPGATGSVGLTVWWKRVTAEYEVAPSIGSYGNHTITQTFWITNPKPTGNPIVTVATKTVSTVSSTVNYPTLVPSELNCFLLGFVAVPTSTASTVVDGGDQQVPGCNGTSTAGYGGGLASIYGPWNGALDSVPGALGQYWAPTSHLVTPSTYVAMTIAIAPPVQHTYIPHPPTVQISKPTLSQPPQLYTEQNWGADNFSYYFVPYLNHTGALPQQVRGKISTYLMDSTNNYGDKPLFGFAGTGTVNDPNYVAPVMRHSIDFTTQTAVLNGVTITDFTTLFDYFEPASLSSAGMLVSHDNLGNTPIAKGALLTLMQNLDYAIVIEWDQHSLVGSYSEVMGFFNSAAQTHGGDIQVHNGYMNASDWSGNYAYLTGAVTANSRHRIAVSFDTNGWLSAFDGNGASHDVQSSDAFVPYTIIAFGNDYYYTDGSGGVYNLDGTIRKVEFYDRGLTASQVKNLSSLT